MPKPNFFSLNTKLTYKEPYMTSYRPEDLTPVQKADFQQTKSWELPHNSDTFAGLGCITVLKPAAAFFIWHICDMRWRASVLTFQHCTFTNDYSVLFGKLILTYTSQLTLAFHNFTVNNTSILTIQV